MSTMIVLRHGESTWNAENRFTGWTDVDLSEKGEAEACSAGQLLAEETEPPPALLTASGLGPLTERAIARVGRHWPLG